MVYKLAYNGQQLHEVFSTSLAAIDLLRVIHNEQLVSKQTISEQRLPLLKQFCANNNLSLAVSDYKFLDHDGWFDASIQRLDPSGFIEGFFHAYISQNHEYSKSAKSADFTRDYIFLAELTGVPNCCSKFLVKSLKEGAVTQNDLIKQSLSNESKKPVWQNNPFLSSFGKGAISHVPCSIECSASASKAKRSLNILQSYSPSLVKELTQWLQKPVIISEEIHILKEYAHEGDKIRYRGVASTSDDYLHNLIDSHNIIDTKKKCVGEIPLPQHSMVRW